MKSIPTKDLGLERRFNRIEKLYTPKSLNTIRSTQFTVVGLGGVGSWAAEALVRLSALNLTLIDSDCVAESNTNRQIHALGENYGKPKTQALAERFVQINPLCKITQIAKFIDEKNVLSLLPSSGVVIDCIDNTRAKAAIIALCLKRKQLVITCGGAGGRTNPMRINSADLALTRGDPLLSRVRTILRKDYGFPKANKNKKPKKFGVTAVYSEEPMKSLVENGINQNQSESDCACYGTSVVVTASMGLAAVSAALEKII